MEYHIQDNYYFDIDDQQQFRIAGPGNHLLIGFSVLHEIPYHIQDYYIDNQQLVVKLSFENNRVNISYPLVCDIRTLRSNTEGKPDRPRYSTLAEKHIAELFPKTVVERHFEDLNVISFSREFENEQGLEQQYGAVLEVPTDTTLQVGANEIQLEADHPINLTIRTITNIQNKESFVAPIFNQEQTFPELRDLPSFLQDLYTQSGQQIVHLVRTQKTSSFEYGTVFPRDWIESAQLGQGDLSQSTIDFMYQQSLKHVSEEGVGWHEDLIGEYRYLQNTSSVVDRKMIDIEPLYILGIEQVSKQFLLNNNNARRLKAIGHYIVEQAQQHELITFKKKSTEEDAQYYEVGNWRDSTAAFPSHEPPIAPYDVNCVFYPQALQVIGNYSEFFDIEETDKLEKLIERWQQTKEQFRVYFSQGLYGYSLALHGKPFRPLSVAHLDESYDLFYGNPSLEDTLSFADRMLAEEYFYTPVGPILVAATTKQFTQRHYHGKVIWPKQAAFAIAGLARQYRYGRLNGWTKAALEHVYDAIIRTAESSFRGWKDLGAVTELYYYDAEQKRARFYLDQDDIEGQMSVIQLWSAVGCRRIIKEYVQIKKLKNQPL